MSSSNTCKRPSTAGPAASVESSRPKRATTATKANNVKKNGQKARAKSTLFDDIDAPKARPSVEETQALLSRLTRDAKDSDSDSDSSSDISDAASLEFEDVPAVAPAPKRRKLDQDAPQGDESEDMDFEDVDMTHDQPDPSRPTYGHNNDDDDIEDVNIALNDDGTIAADAATAGNRNVKKGPSKRDRQIRLRTHMMHVQTLVFHNAVRNSWLNDNQVQSILVDNLSEGVKKEVTRWRVDMGYQSPPEEPKKGKRGKKRSTTKNTSKEDEKQTRHGRDWGVDATRLEKGVVNMSSGDPLMRLLKILAAYWKKSFIITAPGSRKQGYMPLRRLADDINHWAKNKSDTEEHGERIEDISQFRTLAKKREGSRDVGAQLFTALLRGLGIETRMVASLQPVGFGWNKLEEAAPKKPRPTTDATGETNVKTLIAISDDEDDEAIVQSARDAKKRTSPNKLQPTKNGSTRTTRGGKTEATKTVVTIASQSDSSDLSDAPSSSPTSSSDEDDDASIIDVTPSAASTKPRQPHKKFDRDLAFPHYWSEVLSPISNSYIPVDPIVLSTIASNQELLSTFEPRGRAADTAKQVICYTLAYNSDATAKDVTVRYLKRHQLPGRTKGFRMPVEKVPIYNKKGKVLRYEEQDWFSTVILPFLRPSSKKSEADKNEDKGDLKPFKPAKEAAGKNLGEESLQWYKQSADFVLERHLRREEALLPSAKPVRTFTSGKGDKAKSEPVFSRSDVVACKTVESWHKEGRQILPGAQPMKMVPVRAVTLIRKREMEDVLKETGEKLKQGLYARKQTEWIIPPPIGPDRSIPKNAFGNMDVYVPSMVPQGAVHIRLKGCAKLCRKMNIEHAEACVGFEFGKQRAVPVLFGVVVAEENEGMVRDAWTAEQEIQQRKEDVKREAMVLALWRKFTMGLRIVERMKAEYKDRGDGGEEINPFVNRDRQKKQNIQLVDTASGYLDETMEDLELNVHDDGDGGGGFFLPGEEEAILAGPKPTVHATMDEDMEDGDGGGFLLEDDEGQQPQTKTSDAKSVKTAAPMSLQSAHRHLSSHAGASEDDSHNASSVSYTHLTLPTKRIV